ncbi:uncharacterized protein LOC143181508 [Calliopsis andreniformis]|uniref:uncharacterized protein LOC143181508 n=1 Tax=Calliopsis andreniformis TaxID=337506 RepID=UPI003FCC7664
MRVVSRSLDPCVDVLVLVQGELDDLSFTEEKMILPPIKPPRKVEFFYCDKCHRRFVCCRTLKSHRSNDCGKTYICPFCNKLFNYRASFCRHKKRCILRNDILKTKR